MGSEEVGSMVSRWRMPGKAWNSLWICDNDHKQAKNKVEYNKEDQLSIHTEKLITKWKSKEKTVFSHLHPLGR